MWFLLPNQTELPNGWDNTILKRKSNSNQNDQLSSFSSDSVFVYDHCVIIYKDKKRVVDEPSILNPTDIEFSLERRNRSGWELLSKKKKKTNRLKCLSARQANKNEIKIKEERCWCKQKNQCLLLPPNVCRINWMSTWRDWMDWRLF